MNDVEVERFEEFFGHFYAKDMMAAAAAGKKSIEVDFALLDKFDPMLADKLLNDPDVVLAAARDAIKTIDLPEGSIALEPRFMNLPENQMVRIRNLRSNHIGRFITIDGVVRRASEVKPEISVATFECPDCGKKIHVPQTDRILKGPGACPECGYRGQFSSLIDKKLFDARWLTADEPFETATGDKPGEIAIYVRDDLTTPDMQRKCDPGNRLLINGVVRELRRVTKGRMRTQMDIYIEANHIQATEIEWEEVIITKEDEDEIKRLAADPDVYKKLVASIAPSIYGLDEVKQAISLQLFGGVPHMQTDGTRIRGDIHVLLLGDPSCLIADERVVMADGTIMKIGEMGSTHLQKIDYNVHMGKGRHTGKATTFHAYKKQPIIEIITETGKSIKGTYNQPILVVKDREQLWRRLDEIKLGDKVRILPKIECRKKIFVETNWMDYPYFHKSWHIKVPEVVDESLAGLFGYILADGWVDKRRVGFVVNKDEEDIIPKITAAFEKCFDAPVGTYEHSIASPKIRYYQVNRTHIARLLSFLNEKRVPDLIFKSGDKVVAAFLRWLYEGDGCVFSKGRGSLSVSLRSNNIELLRDVQMLLLRFGIHSRILWDKRQKSVRIKERNILSKPSGTLMIRRSEAVLKFWRHIGFVSQKKRVRMDQAMRYAKAHVHRTHQSRTERIVEISKLPAQDVFDIEVPEHHRFVANGIVVHNTAKSQLLKLISSIIPRGKYVSGRGTTAAGLTATVVKDEEFAGGWMLEAGAMVLCHKGVIAIDEFDKMSIEDQIAMHEALEQQTVSIAKAAIIATLPAQVSVLAGANPKLSRFDVYKSVAEQINIPDTLLSRFDLKFALRDVPDQERDAKLATHIMETRLQPELARPLIEPVFLRKYIAYARKHCMPEMTRPAMEQLKNFYVNMRAQATPDTVPITLRQNEALMRLAESSAKVRLSKTVDIEDAQRAIDVMTYSLKQLAYDQTTGKMDIDRTEGVAASQRSKIRTMLDIIENLEKDMGKQIPREEIIVESEEQGITRAEADELIERLIRDGTLHYPRIGIVQRTR